MSERVHVLFFSTELGRGGAEKHLVRVANHLDRGAFRVSVAPTRGGGTFEAELRDDIGLHALGTRRMILARKPLRALVERIRPDVVCGVMDHANVVAVLACAGLRGGPAVVGSVQDAIRLRYQVDRSHRLRERALLAALPFVYPRADHIVTLSEGVRRDLLQIAPRIAGRVSVIPNAGLDGETAEAGPAEPRPDGPVIVASGRMTEQKGFGYLLQALRILRERTPATLWLLGEGPLRGELEAQAARLGIADAVRFPGFRADPHAFVRAADVFVLSSVYESFGNVIVEAMAVGTPVVAADCPYGPREIIRDGVDGVLAPPRDPAALAAAVQRLLDDPALRRRLGEAGRVRARDFSAPAIAARYGDLFERVHAARAATRAG
ncbi:MAG TPA: glycosyltransferase [Longimicrobium sp.]|nr:glycosyltransferase [Longimicrobium sp.]